MITEIINRWELNKTKLQEYFSGIEDRAIDYIDIFKKLFELVINDEDDYELDFDISKLTVIDHGGYQGSQLFIIPRKTYQPSPSDYILCHNYYGSCSGCDTLQGIWGYGTYDDEGEEIKSTITKKQTEELMTLALHMVQRMKYFEAE